jgi:glycosyltransferase involved in cell wall biosynthesis
LPHARNTALGFARGDFGFVLDADNAVYPNGIERLVAALDAEQDADFAYGVLECFDASGARGLTSVGPWDPARLRVMNYIDAMALIRLRALRALGGYATDERLHGWEDYDLWCRMANSGRRGVSVPGIVGRYRVAEHSMVRGLTAISVRDAFSVLIERSPQLMAGVSPPP